MQLNTLCSRRPKAVRRIARRWFAGLAIGAAMLVATNANAQSVGPRTISYQGVLETQGVAAQGPVSLTVNYYTTGGATPIFSETFTNVPLINGVFNLQLGSTGTGFPASMNFSQPMEIGVSVNGGPEMSPRTPLSAVPFAMTAYTLNGIPASATPMNGTIFPLPLDGNGRIASSLLPSYTLNGIMPMNGNFNISAGPNVTITRDTTTNTLIIGSTATSGGSTMNIFGNNGVVATTSNDTVTIGLNPAGFSGTLIQPGTIGGRALASSIAGVGLYQDQLGNLNVGFDSSMFTVNNNQLTLRPGLPYVGGSGSFTTLTSSGTSMIGTGANALVNSFGTGGNAMNVMNTIGSTGEGSMTTINGNVLFTGGINVNGGTITNVGPALGPNDVITRGYVDSVNTLTGTLGGDLMGTTGAAQLNPLSPGLADRLLTILNTGSMWLNDNSVTDSLTVNGGTINNTPIGMTGASTAAFTTLSSSGATTLGTGGANVGIGTSSPGATLDVVGTNTNQVLSRLWNTGTGNAVDRIVAGGNANSVIELTDANSYVSSISSNANTGLSFNVRPSTAANTQAGLAGSTVLTLGPNGNVLFNADSIDFGGARLTNIGAPMGVYDLVNRYYVDSVATFAGTLGGDVTGTTGAAQINPLATGLGDRLITALNNGSTTINGLRILPNFDTATVTGGAANFSSLDVTGNTTLASSAGSNATIGNATGTTTLNGQILLNNSTSVSGQTNGAYLQSFATGSNFSTGLVSESSASGGIATRPAATALLGVAKWTGIYNSGQEIAGVVGKAEANAGVNAIGVVGQATGANLAANTGVLGWADSSSMANVGVLAAANATQSQLTSLASSIPYGSRTGLYAYVPSTANGTNTAAIVVNNGTANGTAINVVSGGLRASATTGQAGGSATIVSDRFADVVALPSGGTSVTINNSLVTPNSVIIITQETSSSSGKLYITSKSTGSFTVATAGSFGTSDKLDYLIVNP